jgi:hypothetical protein
MVSPQSIAKAIAKTLFCCRIRTWEIDILTRNKKPKRKREDMGVPEIEEKLKDSAKLEKAKACLTCPLQNGVETELPSTPSFRHTVAAIRIRVTCGACDNQQVKPSTESCHRKCQRWNRFYKARTLHQPTVEC